MGPQRMSKMKSYKAGSKSERPKWTHKKKAASRLRGIETKIKAPSCTVHNNCSQRELYGAQEIRSGSERCIAGSQFSRRRQ